MEDSKLFNEKDGVLMVKQSYLDKALNDDVVATAETLAAGDKLRRDIAVEIKEGAESYEKDVTVAPFSLWGDTEAAIDVSDGQTLVSISFKTDIGTATAKKVDDGLELPETTEELEA